MPNQLSIQLRNNIKAVRKGLENLKADLPLVANSRLWAAILWVKKKLQYTQTRPPRLPYQKYIRTFTLMRGYKVGKSKAGNYFFRSTAPYTQGVLGNAFGQGQWTIHQGRWPLMRDVVELLLVTLPGKVRDGIHLAVAHRAKDTQK